MSIAFDKKLPEIQDTLSFFCREHFLAKKAPMKKVRRFIPANILKIWQEDATWTRSCDNGRLNVNLFLNRLEIYLARKRTG